MSYALLFNVITLQEYYIKDLQQNLFLEPLFIIDYMRII